MQKRQILALIGLVLFVAAVAWLPYVRIPVWAQLPVAVAFFGLLLIGFFVMLFVSIVGGVRADKNHPRRFPYAMVLATTAYGAVFVIVQLSFHTYYPALVLVIASFLSCLIAAFVAARKNWKVTLLAAAFLSSLLGWRFSEELSLSGHIVFAAVGVGMAFGIAYWLINGSRALPEEIANRFDRPNLD